MRKLFGTDGIRGIANVHPMTVKTALDLGRAVAFLFRQGEQRRRIVVGKDTRRSCYMFESALAAGICSMGADCWFCGPLPTPGVAHLTSTMRAEAGVVISASHNPYQDNGIKIFASDGFKLPDDTEAELERLMSSEDLDQHRVAAGRVGRVTRIAGVDGRYVSFLKYAFPDDLRLDGLRIAVDCANGAAFKVAPCVFEELGADVIALSTQPNGSNINDQCGALHPEQLQRAVVEQGAHLGVALDGDADRVIIVDERGEIVDGDAVMALIGTRMLREGKLKHDTLVVTVMSNLGLERCISQAGGKIVRTPVGDRYVVDEMRRGGYNLGGEQSGHLVFLDYATTGDGVLAALQVLATMLRTEKPVSELAAVMTRYPQVLVNTRVDEKRPLDELPELQRAVQAVEQRLAGEGRVLVRYSGTEAKARVMVEGPDAQLIKGMADELVGVWRKACAV